MFLRSCSGSDRDLRPTWLSMFETMFASTFALVLAYHLGTVFYIFLTGIFAPFLLLRTDFSDRVSAKVFVFLMPGLRGTNLFWTGFYYAQLLPAAMVSRFAGVLVHPWRGIKAFPKNWFRILACTDVFTKIDFIPGVGSPQHVLAIHTSYSVRRRLRSGEFYLWTLVFSVLVSSVYQYPVILDDFSHWLRSQFGVAGAIASRIILMCTLYLLVSLLLICLFAPLCHLSGYVYRLSLKSSVIVWFPLFLAASTAFSKEQDILSKLKEEREDAFARLLRFFAAFGVVWGLFHLMVLPSFSNELDTLEIGRAVSGFIEARNFYFFNLAFLLSSFFKLVTYFFFFDRAERRIQTGVWSKETVSIVHSRVTVTQGVLAVYTSAVLLDALAKLLPSIKFADIVLQFFPS